MYFQAEWLLKLQAISPSPIFVSNNTEGTFLPGPWTNLLSWHFASQGLIDYRNVLANELCWELDFGNWGACRLWGLRLQAVLNDLQVPHLMCMSGGKGLHCHTWLDCDGLESIATWKQLREKLWVHIVDLVGVPMNLRSVGKGFDTSSYTFNPGSQGHLIREIGGRKWQRKRVITEIPRTNIIIGGDIQYPKRVPIWKPPTRLLLEKLQLENLEATGNCLKCKIPIPSQHVPVFRRQDHNRSNPMWSGCALCKRGKSPSFVVGLFRTRPEVAIQ